MYIEITIDKSRSLPGCIPASRECSIESPGSPGCTFESPGRTLGHRGAALSNRDATWVTVRNNRGLLVNPVGVTFCLQNFNGESPGVLSAQKHASL